MEATFGGPFWARHLEVENKLEQTNSLIFPTKQKRPVVDLSWARHPEVENLLIKGDLWWTFAGKTSRG